MYEICVLSYEEKNIFLSAYIKLIFGRIESKGLNLFTLEKYSKMEGLSKMGSYM